MESINEMANLAGVDFNSSINEKVSNLNIDKIDILNKIVKLTNNDEYSNIKDNINDKSYLFTSDDIYDIFTSDDNIQIEKVVDLLKDAYEHRTIDVCDFVDVFGCEYDNIFNEIFKDGVDLIDGEFEIKPVSELDCKNFINICTRLELSDGKTIYAGTGKSYSVEDVTLLSKGDVIEAQMRNDGKAIPILVQDQNFFARGFDIVYNGSHGTVTFRVVNDKMAVKIGVGLNLIKFKYIQFNYLNEPVYFNSLFNENIERAKLCALAVARLRKENMEDTKAYSIYDIFKMFGMTKYEQIGFMASIATRGVFDFSEYGRFDVRLLDSLKNGVPETIISQLELTTDNVMSELLERIDAMENESVDEDEDPNVAIIRNTLQLFADIINEKFDPMDGIYVAELADSLDSSFDLGIACSHYVNSDDAIEIYNKIKNECQLFKNRNKNLNYAAAYTYYTILAQKMSMAKYILFANEVTRECSFLEPDKQRHFGFSSTVIGLGPLKRQCDMQSRILKGKPFTFELSNLETSFCNAMDRSNSLEQPYIEMLKTNSKVFVYYLIQYCYYIYKKDQKAIQALPVTVTNGADNKVLILFDLAKLPIKLADEVIQMNVEPSLIQSFSTVVEDSIKNCNINPLSNKVDKNFMSTFDYLKLQFVQDSTGITMDYFCANLLIDYDNIINADKVRTIKTMPITDPSIYGLSPFYRLGESVKGNIQDYYKTSVAANFDELSFQYQDAITVIEGCMDGVQQVGCADDCLPPVAYNKKFIKDCYKTNRTLNHMKFRWDINTARNKDLMDNLGYSAYTDANFTDAYKIENTEVNLSPEQYQFANYCVDKLKAKYEKFYKITDNDMIAIELEAKYLAVNCFTSQMQTIFDKLKYAVIAQNEAKTLISQGVKIDKQKQEELQNEAAQKYATMSDEQKLAITKQAYEVCMNRSSFSLDSTSEIINYNTIVSNISVEPEKIAALNQYISTYQPLSMIGNNGVFYNNDIRSIFDKEVLESLAFKVNDNNYILKLKNKTYNIILERRVTI